MSPAKSQDYQEEIHELDGENSDSDFSRDDSVSD